VVQRYTPDLSRLRFVSEYSKALNLARRSAKGGVGRDISYILPLVHIATVLHPLECAIPRGTPTTRSSPVHTTLTRPLFPHRIPIGFHEICGGGGGGSPETNN
jgi:hypothetical protein